MHHPPKCYHVCQSFLGSVQQEARHLLFLQEVYCFVLPFILKWVVAALVVSVLVNLFSRLRKQGDHSHSSVVAQIRAMLMEGWQRLFQQAPSNQNMLLTFFRLNGRGRTFKAMPSFIRYTSIPGCKAWVKLYGVTAHRTCRTDGKYGSAFAIRFRKCSEAHIHICMRICLACLLAHC